MDPKQDRPALADLLARSVSVRSGQARSPRQPWHLDRLLRARLRWQGKIL